MARDFGLFAASLCCWMRLICGLPKRRLGCRAGRLGANSHTNSDANSDSDSDSNANPDANSDANSHTHSDSQFEPRLHARFLEAGSALRFLGKLYTGPVSFECVLRT